MEHPPETDIGKANKTPNNKFHERPEGQETRWRHRDGPHDRRHGVRSPLVDGMGQQVGWMGSIVDVTERKRLGRIGTAPAGGFGQPRPPLNLGRGRLNSGS